MRDGVLWEAKLSSGYMTSIGYSENGYGSLGGYLIVDFLGFTFLGGFEDKGVLVLLISLSGFSHSTAIHSMQTA
jgi:hypothetical protein